MSEISHKILKANILVVDDETFNLSLVKRFLETEGYSDIQTTSDPLAVSDLHKQHDFDLILLDIHMPELDGFGVMAELAELPNSDYLPILVFTGDNEKETRLRALEAGAKDFLTKPLDRAEASQRIRNMLEVRTLYNQNKLERDRYQDLLLNMLPSPIVARLNAGEEKIADSLDDITVLFADLVGFTAASSKLSPSLIVDSLNNIFGSFDTLADQHAIQKIKTIGDAYMAVAGLSGGGSSSTIRMANFGISLVSKMEELRATLPHPFAVRVGIHAGPAIAGILSGKRSGYDVWGDTVNTASRFESTCETGKVAVSKIVADRLQGTHSIIERGLVSLAGKGEVEAYFIEASADKTNPADHH